MTLSKADRATIERLTDTIAALTTSIEELTRQLKANGYVEMERMRLLAELLEVKPKRQRERAKAK